eukprot:CAMPEP_0194305196 /NCGR_PEP_ID=MMETSP0171-20130528/2686_1 /TAXON_ID=218684 /ORGANISM="Corethron pennatum, Strain L29A3" /LENGTH=222 /DNA_ID=CAMNT_0039056649 /DNA_START=128 /DNA_END=793 /DNA_ORIENTATION=+
MTRRDSEQIILSEPEEDNRIHDNATDRPRRRPSVVRTLSSLFFKAPAFATATTQAVSSHSNSINVTDESNIETRSSRSFANCYDLQEKVLGRGTFAEVKVVVYRQSGNQYAVKIIKKSKLNKTAKTRLMDEISILQSLKHHRIVSLVDYFDGEMDVPPAPNYYLVMDLLKGGELFDRVVKRTSYNEADARLLCKLLLGAMEYMHGKGIAHRDLKPENIFLES